MKTERCMTQTELAERWRLSEATLERWRTESGGPLFLKLGNQVRYRLHPSRHGLSPSGCAAVLDAPAFAQCFPAGNALHGLSHVQHKHIAATGHGTGPRPGCVPSLHIPQIIPLLTSPEIQVHETQHSPNPHDSYGDEISLLDLLATLTENLRLLVLGPLLAGLAALGVSFVLPPTYESRSVLRLEESTTALINSADLLAPLLPQAPWIAKDAPLSVRLQKLRDDVKSSYNKKDKTLTIVVSGPSPQESQQLHNAVINELRKQMRPKGLSLEQIERRRATAQSTLDELSQVIPRLAKTITREGTETEANTRAYSLLLTQRLNSQQILQDIELSLKPLGDEAFVQTPSLPDKPTQPKKGLITVVATLATGFALLVFVFLRQALRNAKRHNPQDAERLATIKKNTAKSLGLGDRQL